MLGVGRGQDAGLPPVQSARASLTPVACGRSVAGWARELVASRGSGTDPFLSLCLWSAVPQFPPHKTGRTACLGPARSAQRDGLCGAPRTRQPSAPLLPFTPSVQPRGRGKKCPPAWQPSKDTGKPLCRPPCSAPASLDRLVGSGGAVGVGSPSLLTPRPPGKSRTVPLGNSPCGQTPGSPGSLGQSGHCTLQFAWKGLESPALACPWHSTV